MAMLSSALFSLVITHYLQEEKSSLALNPLSQSISQPFNSPIQALSHLQELTEVMNIYASEDFLPDLDIGADHLIS